MSQPKIKSAPERPELGPLMKTVESMGCSCELGLVQRHCKIEPMGLFRFTFTPLEGLLDALRNDFAGLADPDQLFLKDGLGGWMIHHRRYRFEFHAYKRVDTDPAAEVLESMSGHLEFLTGLFLDTLLGAEKLFVFQAGTAATAGRDALRREYMVHAKPERRCA